MGRGKPRAAVANIMKYAPMASSLVLSSIWSGWGMGWYSIGIIPHESFTAYFKKNSSVDRIVIIHYSLRAGNAQTCL